MKVWELMIAGAVVVTLNIVFWAVVILGGIWAVVWLLRYLQIIT